MEAPSLDPLDVEELLATDLSTDACRACAPPVPVDLSERLPLAMVQRDGGTRAGTVMDAHNVTVSVWAGTWAEAMREANRVCGSIARLVWTDGASVQWRRTDVTALPFAAPDPRHQDIPRVQLTATVWCRATD